MQVVMIPMAKYLFLLIGLLSAGYWLTLRKDQRIQFLVYFAVAGIVALVLTKLAGMCFVDPRPFVVHHFIPLIPHAADNGFPSDHTVLSVLMALIVLKYSRKVGLALLVLALLVGWSRVFVGVHNPIDIVGAVLIAVLAATGTGFVFKRLLPSTAQTQQTQSDIVVTGN